MICNICGKEFSDKVCMIHMRTCKKIEVEEVKIDKKPTVKELKELCRNKGITGYSNLKEKELIEVLKDVM